MAAIDSGITYVAAKRAFMSNYLIAVGIVFVAVLATLRFDLGFSFTPATNGEFIGTMLYYVLLMGVAYLVMEPFNERMIRRYMVSNSDIIKIEGIFQKKRDVIPYQSISEVNVTKGLMGRILNYGRVEISGFGKSPLVMRHMKNPEEIQRILQNKISSNSPASLKKKLEKDEYIE